MPAVVLFVFYAVVLAWIVYRWAKRNGPGLPAGVLVAAFAFKVLLGCLYGAVFLHYYGGDDTWMYHRDSLVEYQMMIHQPGQFFREFLPFNSFDAAPGFWEGMRVYIMDLENQTLTKLLAVFDIFSRGNYYINVLFFDFIIFAGPVWLFKLILPCFPNKRTVLTLAIFFIPSFMFWLSGIRAEGPLLLCLAAAIYYTQQWFVERRLSRFLAVLTSLAGMLVFRPEFLFIFIPAFFSWTLSLRNPRKTIQYFCIVYTVSLLVFFGSSWLSPAANFPGVVVSKQQEFSLLHGNTSFKLDKLQPSLTGFLQVFPQAFANTFLRPFIWEAKGLLQMLTSLSVMACWFLFIFYLLFPDKNLKPDPRRSPLLHLFGWYGVTQILLVGYIVPFPGAITRYMIIPQLLLVLALALQLRWSIKKTH